MQTTRSDSVTFGVESVNPDTLALLLGIAPCPNEHGPDGVIPCWSPGGPCPSEQEVCESCGPCAHCKPHRPTHHLTFDQTFCPVVVPHKRRGLTGKAYRAARRRYHRELHAYRRGLIPDHQVRWVIPRAEVILVPGDTVRGARVQATIIDEGDGWPDLSTER